jgi:diguanylate cyclase (GGDEF)-like protein
MDGGTRETAGTLTALIVQYVRRAGGDAAVDQVLEESGIRKTAAELEDESGWSTYEEKIALWEAAAAVLHDPVVSRHMGEACLETNIGATLRFILRGVGSPKMVLANVARVAPKFSTSAKMTATTIGKREMRVTYELDASKQPHLLDCESNIGLMAAIGPLFGLPLLTIDHPECQVNGAPQCVYLVRWPRSGRLWRRGSSRSYLREQVAALTTQVESLQSTTADLVSSEDTRTVLDHIVRRAGQAVSAQRYLLAVRTRENGPLEVHFAGFDGAGARALGEQLVEGDVPASDEHRIVIDVASARRHYGRLVALYDDYSFFDHERHLLSAYARSAAAALDAAVALEEARSRGETASALLELARRLAVLSEPEQVAQQIAEAMAPVLGARMSSVFLYDPERGVLVLRGSHGLSAEQQAALTTIDLRHGPNDPGFSEWLDHPHPRLSVRGDAKSVASKAAMDRLGVDVLATVAIGRRGELLGMANVYFDDVDAISDPTSMFERMSAVADQAATALENSNLLAGARHQATHDDLTGLPNRALFEDAARRAIAQSRRLDEPVALLFVDLDGFKAVNDDFGHVVGDELLKVAARRMSECLRAGDVVARLGGDEFTVLLPATPAAEAHEIAERLRDRLGEPLDLPAGTVSVSACVGIGVAPDDARDYKQLLRAADSAMYRAKRLGRDRSVRHDAA